MAQKKSRKLLLVILSALLLIQAAVTVKVFYLTDHLSTEIYTHNIPSAMGEWIGMDIPVEDYVIKILETKDILYRKYSHPDHKPVYLSIVFSPDNRKIVHPPEVCYTAGGWEVMKDHSFNTNVLDIEYRMKELFIEQGRYQQVVWYFFKSGEKLTDNYYLQQLNVVLAKLFGREGNAALIRFSTDFGPKTSHEQAQKNLSAFLNDSLESIIESLP